MPPLVAWAATTGSLSWTAVYLFAIIVCWTPPHFWALSLMLKDEYANVGLPMLPVVRGERETRRQILLYSLLLVAVTHLPFYELPFGAGGLGAIYLAGSAVMGALFIAAAVRLHRQADGARRCVSTSTCSPTWPRCSQRWSSTRVHCTVLQ